MQVIQPINNLVGTLISPNVNAKRFKPSCFNIVTKLNNDFILFNTLTRILVLLNEKEITFLKECDSSQQNEITLQLIKLHFLVDYSINETDRYMQVQNMNKLIRQSNKKIKSFKIYTTTHCNARCFYCFEEGMHKEHMSIETANNVIKYIYKNKADERIRLYWFGGEPLCNYKIIDLICQKLKKDNIEFESHIITNGLLFDNNLIKKATREWNLTFVQITLDGFGEEHNKRKKYTNPNLDPFAKTIENILLLKSYNIKMIVRLNFDTKNFENVKRLIQFLKEKISDYRNITVFPVLLIDDCFSKNVCTSAEKEISNIYLNELKEILYKEGMLHFTPVYKNLPINHCMADNVSCAIIGTDGRLFTCQSYDENMCYGDITNGITKPDIIFEWRNPTVIREKCCDCVCLPECTAFNLCPVESEFCKENKLYNIRKKMIATVKNEKRL